MTSPTSITQIIMMALPHHTRNDITEHKLQHQKAENQKAESLPCNTGFWRHRCSRSQLSICPIFQVAPTIHKARSYIRVSCFKAVRLFCKDTKALSS